MGKRYLDTKKDSLESSILNVWQEAAVKQEKLVGGQKKLDKDKDGDIDGKDFAMLRKTAKKDKKEGAMKRGKDLDTFKPKPKKEELDEGTKQVLAHGGKGQYKAVRDGDITKIMYKGKVVGTADFDRGADSFMVSMKGQKGQKSFDDAQAMVDYFAKNKIVEESYEIGTDEYRKHTQDVTPGQSVEDYGRMKMQSMKEALAKVWGLEEEKDKKDLTKEMKGGKTLTGKKVDEVDVEPKMNEKKR